MRHHRFLVFVLLWAATTAAGDRLYVGQSVCRQCHPTQANHWFNGKHAQAWAALSRPESVEIARLSGIAENPYSNPVCLGCHTTASDVEDWERDDTFHIEDGVQCELCHGPGSEYIDADVMSDPDAARQAGLKIPDKADCLVCHKPKGSHIASLDVRQWVYEEAIAEIAHPGPAQPAAAADFPSTEATGGAEYVGALACARCHDRELDDAIYSRWRLTPHARAYTGLASARGLEIADQSGVRGNPQHSPQCLPCHSTGSDGSLIAEGFELSRGVQCESCHGPGSEYMSEAVMLDPVSARRAGLTPVTEDTCVRCHEPGVHGRKFDFRSALPRIDHSSTDQQHGTTNEIAYKTPFNLTVSPDGSRLYVVCEASDSLAVIDTSTRTVITEVRVGNLPHGVCLSPDGSEAFVSNRGSDSVSVVDTATLEVTNTISVGDEPHGLVTDASGKKLYVANAGTEDVSVVDLDQGLEVSRLAAARGAWDVALTADDSAVLVTNNLSHHVPFRHTSQSEVTVIETAASTVVERHRISDANLVQGVAADPGGAFALVTLIRTKNLVPMTRVLQGWVLTNGIGVIWPDGRVDQLLLDEPDRYFADPTDIAMTPNGRLAFVTGGGIDAVAVIDVDTMIGILEGATPDERRHILPNHLGISTEFVLERIPVGTNPRGLAVSPDGRWLYVADALDDTVSVIDIETLERTAAIDLNGPKEITLTRKGERIFHSANATFGQQFSCHSCHPDGGIDSITYDIEPDGIGVNPVDNRSLRGVLDTAPFKWTGKNPSLARQCGPRLAVFFTRIDPFTPDQVTALERYICTIPRNPNRYRAIGEDLTPAQRRGKLMFERDRTNSGDLIEPGDRCINCHRPPYYTNREKVYVGPGSHLDTHDIFDVPHLTNVYESAPYLHDGRAATLEEIWTRFNPYDDHGVTNDMTKDQLNDLVEYLKTL